jgi:hypothetical protein
MDELIRGFEEVLSDTAQLLGLEEAEPVRRYDPPTRPSYAEPVSHATDAARPKKYTGEVALPLTEFSIRCARLRGMPCARPPLVRLLSRLGAPAAKSVSGRCR